MSSILNSQNHFFSFCLACSCVRTRPSLIAFSPRLIPCRIASLLAFNVSDFLIENVSFIIAQSIEVMLLGGANVGWVRSESQYGQVFIILKIIIHLCFTCSRLVLSAYPIVQVWSYPLLPSLNNKKAGSFLIQLFVFIAIKKTYTL